MNFDVSQKKTRETIFGRDTNVKNKSESKSNDDFSKFSDS